MNLKLPNTVFMAHLVFHLSSHVSLLQGSSFDSDAKSWRLFADVANDIGEHQCLVCWCETSRTCASARRVFVSQIVFCFKGARRILANPSLDASGLHRHMHG